MVHFAGAAVAPMISFADVRLSNGVRLHYAEQGPATAPAIVLLHGYSDSWFSFSRVMPLMPAEYRVIAIDARGHGDSERPAGGYRIEDMADDVLLLLDALKIRSAVIVGHSMGSFVAQAIAGKAPYRVTSLVLIGSAPVFDNANIRELVAAVGKLSDPIDRDFVRDFQYSTINQPVPEAFMLKAIANSERMPARVWKQIAQGFLEYHPAAARPRVRTLVIGGRKDGVFSVDEHVALARQFDAPLELFDDIGHTLHWEDPGAFVQVLRRFLE
jgi:non-heme chloroperoxidase